MPTLLKERFPLKLRRRPHRSHRNYLKNMPMSLWLRFAAICPQCLKKREIQDIP
tara:strand:- start:46 stop:207 length:162 start_codon:yes stop_codon:yes gene_type:complete